jgi:hypothetical protein
VLVALLPEQLIRGKDGGGTPSIIMETWQDESGDSLGSQPLAGAGALKPRELLGVES